MATDRLTEVHATLTAAVENLVSGSDWQEMLDVAARFHRYSASNVMLIRVQRPDATRVAGYRKWQSLGRQVKRGEKGIAILAPCVYRRRPLTDDEAAERPELAKVLRGFTVVHVFDIAQTDGEPLPDVRPTLLEGEATDGLWDALATQVVSAGFSVERGDCGPANGRTDYATQSVRVRDDVAPAQATKTLTHELAHVLLHDASRVRAGRDLAEVEAESVAYIVCHVAGVETGGYSFPYIAHWSDGDAAIIRATAERVVSAARQVLDALGLTATDDDEVAA
jgi:antirestriction protein ArdC